MASIHKQPGKPFYFAAFYDPEGFRRFRSTGTDNAKVASKITDTIDTASFLARRGKLSNEKALKLIREACDAIGETQNQLAASQAQKVLQDTIEEFVKLVGGELTTYSIKGWFDTWLTGRTDASKATVVTYRGVLDEFTRFLGARASRPLTTLQTKQIEDFKAKYDRSPGTVNRALKVLKACLNNAVKKRQLEFNPAEHVEFIAREEDEDGKRRPFTDEELKAILTVAKDDKAEWRTMVLVGFYLGLRLRDCANLTWREVQLHRGEVNTKTMKTGRQQIIPIAEPLARHLATIAGDDPTAPLCAGLYGKPAAWLSAQFYDLMVDAKLVAGRNHQGKGKGRAAKREKNPISFHSLRYNCTSALKSGGVSDAVAMDLIGHETPSISQNYTKIDEGAKREAISKLPDITTL